MELHQIRYFLAVAETLNFNRAAERCNVSQPTLTRAIKKLEEELGGPLFRRERKLTHLTDLGRLMRPHLEADTIGEYGQRIAAEDMVGEDIQCVKDMLRHAGPPDRRFRAIALIQN
jgi:DNA-binding MarR family transcriptional regulator